ncbi:MAG: ester cyclase [Acidobacteria bacterium]|nr:ester cyclase [Acidobacteriota bacterium]
MSEENKALIRRWFEEVWNKGREDAIDEMLADEAVVHGLADESGQPLHGLQDFHAFHQKFRQAFPDIYVTVDDVITEGDKGAVRCSVRGSHTGDSLGFEASHKPVEFTGMSMVRIADGKIVEAWNNFDFMNMYQQIGAR